VFRPITIESYYSLTVVRLQSDSIVIGLKPPLRGAASKAYLLRYLRPSVSLC